MLKHVSTDETDPINKLLPMARFKRSCVAMPADEWHVTIPGHHRAYITWEQFLANRERLAANRTNHELPAGPGARGLLPSPL
jgi:hypothetical protein